MNSKKNNFLTALVFSFFTLLIVFIVAKYVFHIPFDFLGTSPQSQEDTTNSGATLACTREYNPVCGKNGTTYANECLAERANIEVVAHMRCEDVDTNTGSSISDTGSISTVTGDIFDTDTNHENIGCTKEYAPVCGDDGVTYANECVAHEADVTIRSEGKCPAKSDSKNNQESTQNNKSDNNTEKNHTENQKTEDINSTIDNTESDTNTDSGDTVKLPTSIDDHRNDNPNSNDAGIGKLSNYNPDKFHLYSNVAIGYSFAIPNYAYYKGYGPQDGASHTLVAGLTQESVDSFDADNVKVYYYRIQPANPPIGTISVKLSNGAFVYIAGGNNSNSKIANIASIIRESVAIN